MSVGAKERVTQARLLRLLTDELDYAYLGHWKDRVGNSNVEVDELKSWLSRQGHDEKLIQKTLRALDVSAAVGGPRTLYDANKDVYSLLRYGVRVRPDVGDDMRTVWLVDWEDPANNDFAVAQEVTVVGENVKRPDLVLYVNGIAVGVIELKRSIVSVTEGIRQNLDSQKKEFIRPFFSTVQLVMAGNDTEGLRYSAIQTPEKFCLTWKEPSAVEHSLDRAVSQLCEKHRVLELVHDFTVFDAGIKKIARSNQYFGVRAAREHVERREGGIIWHTQGSGKSLTMVWLAKWIRENVEDSRVLIITDRTELDEQIEKVFRGVDEDIYRTDSGADLVNVLDRNDEWLICSLIHKFGSSEEGDVDAFLASIKSQLPKGFRAKGNIFIFVDECHRTQSGALHEAMTAILPDAVLIGFTGTPLLKRDKRRSVEVFGGYIHTYKYDEAVRDGVVLDLRYEARDIDQSLTSTDKIDKWFGAKTAALSDAAKALVKQRWGTMQQVLSAEDRLQKIVADILLDMQLRDRLRSGHGNAILVAGSIYQATRFFEKFDKTDLSGRCAIVTSYRPAAADIKGEESGEGDSEAIEQYETYRKMLAAHFDEPADVAVSKAEQFEKDVKKRFIDEPGQIKLLIVVDKLLTGFDAPSATYIYIDKSMRDHGLFQAICRVNRLHGDDKEYGYVVDYKDLFRSLERSIKDYTGEAFDGFDDEDVTGLLKDRLEAGRERLEEVRDQVTALCEPVMPPRDAQAYLKFFCAADTSDAEELQNNESKRIALYKLSAAYLRAYSNLANDMADAGYSSGEAQVIKDEVAHYEKVRGEVKLASGDYVDMKVFEPAMRHLLDTYIRAEESEVISAFDDFTLVDLIVERGADGLHELPEGLRSDERATAETIEHNVRKVIIDESPVNPKYYERMSELLDGLIEERRKEAIDYKTYLERIVALTKQVADPQEHAAYPSAIKTAAQRALYDNIGNDEATALAVDAAVLMARRDGWRGNKFKEREILIAIKSALDSESIDPNAVFELVQEQSDY